MRSIVFVGVLTLAAWAGGPVPEAVACSCAPISPSEALSQADAVFEGRVVALEPEGDPRIGPSTLRVQLDVVRTWKGVDEPRVEVRTSGSEAACGYPFEARRSYLVYARRGAEAHLHAGLCGRTRPIEEADEELAHLGAGVTPVDPSGQGGAAPAGSTPDAGTSGSAGCGSCAAGAPPAGDLPVWPGILPLLLVLARPRSTNASRNAG